MLGKLAVGIAGVFIGAFAVEYLRRKDPELLERVRRKAGDLADRLFDPSEGEDDEPHDVPNDEDLPAEPASSTLRHWAARARTASMYLYLLAALVFGVVSSLLAFERGRNSLGWFLAGLFIGPFALVVALLPRAPREGRFARCPACLEAIRADAAVCRFCGAANHEQAEVES